MPQTPSFFNPRRFWLYNRLAGQRFPLRSGAASATQPVGRPQFMKLAFDEFTVQVGDEAWTLDRRIIDAVQHDGRVFVVFDYTAYPSGLPANNLVAYDLSGNELWVVGEHPIDNGWVALFECATGFASVLLVSHYRLVKDGWGGYELSRVRVSSWPLLGRKQ